VTRPEKIKITHIISGLSVGGAENTLLKVASSLNQDEFKNTVISLTGGGPISVKLKDKNINVHELNFSKSFSSLKGLYNLTRTLKSSKPHIIQTWMYHADLLGGIVTRLRTNAPVLWNLRQSNFDNSLSKKSTILATQACVYLSKFIPSTVVCGSYAARLTHQKIGYNPTIMQVLPNGYNHDQFKPDPDARGVLTKSLNITDDCFIVGFPARYHPQKDHATFFKAAAIVRQKINNVHFVLCGDSINSENSEIMSMINQNNLKDCIHLLGPVDQMESFYPALDTVVLTSSFGEGAPNIIGEAMASGVPCISTDVGDSAMIIGDTGKNVPHSDPHAMAQAILDLHKQPSHERKSLGRAARQRIIDLFPNDLMIERYEELYRRVFSQHY
jgi:glycosyltransferase involved in cell wall biosynthesis